MLDWFAAGHADLIKALTNADPNLVCWTFLAAPSPLAMWARRQAHETTVHRVGAELAAGWQPAEMPAAFAADGIDRRDGKAQDHLSQGTYHGLPLLQKP